MPFNHDLMMCCVRLIGDVPQPVGSKRGVIGSGFFLSVESESHPMFGYIYVVTAHHVIEDQSRVEVQAADPLMNGGLLEPIEVRDWHQPLDGVDLAVALYPSNEQVRALNLHRNVLPRNGTPFLGSEVFYLGILEPLNRTMARRGTIGALDQEGIEHEGDYDYPCHLLDCRSYEGFSGSPCFLHNVFPILRQATPDPNDPTMKDDGTPLGDMRHHTVLIGMLTEHLEDRRAARVDGVASRYGVGFMLRSREIHNALMTDGMRAERREWDRMNIEREQGEGPKPTQTSVSSVSDEGEYDRFEELTRTLVNTPKPEKDDGESQ